MTTFDNIKFFSKKRGLSLTKLSEKIGMNPNSIYGYNQGKEPRYSTLKKISEALDVPISKLSDKYKDDETKKSSESVDLDDLSTVMTFQGKPIPEKYKEIVRDLLKNLNEKEKNEK